MSNSRILKMVSFLLLFSILLSACQTATPAASNEPAEETVASESQPAEAEASAEKTIVTFSHWWSLSDTKGPVIEEQIASFNEDNPNIELQAQVDPISEHFQILSNSFLAGQEPDITLLGNSTIIDLVEAGQIVPIGPYLDEWFPEIDWYQAALDSQTIDGEVICLPQEGFTWPVWYNMDVLKASGIDTIPATVDELIADAALIRAAGYEPFSIAGKDWPGTQLINLMLESKLGEEKARELFAAGDFSNNEDAKQVIDLFVEMRDSGVFVDNVEGLVYNDMTANFYNDKTAMIFNGSWSYSELPETMTGHVVLGGFPVIPGAASDQPAYWATLGGNGFCMTQKGEENLDAVKAVFQYLFTDENMAQFVEDTGMAPPWNVPVDESKLGQLFAQSLKLQDEHVLYPITDPFFPTTVFQAYIQATENAYLPGRTAEEILTEIDKAYTENQ